MRGSVFAYVLPQDRGTDVLPTGARLDHDGDTRAVVHGEHRAELDEHWTLFAQGAWFSDPTVVPAFFDSLAREHREFTNSLRLRRRDENSVFFAEANARANDFIVNEYLLQAPGYSVSNGGSEAEASLRNVSLITNVPADSTM